jgi:hypothetical protein
MEHKSGPISNNLMDQKKLLNKFYEMCVAIQFKITLLLQYDNVGVTSYNDQDPDEPLL